MELPLKELNELVEVFNEILNDAEKAKADNNYEAAEKVKDAYYECSVKLAKLIIAKGLGESEHFGVHTVNIAYQMEEITPINSKNKITKLIGYIKEVKNELRRDIDKAKYDFEIGLPITRNLHLKKSLSIPEYDNIIIDIHNYGLNMTSTRKTYLNLGEEDIRNTILNTLNTIYPALKGTGESFNGEGKTDILIKNENFESIFIGECKLWKGVEYSVNDGLEQLLERYTTANDSKLSLIVFNKENDDIKLVEQRLKEGVMTFLTKLKLKPRHIIKYTEYKNLFYFECEHNKNSDISIRLSVILININ
ncbi:hypothetical protein [Alkalihalobacillus sp. R86527]|uniref:hypothetical protein n=1 Tax=Alkalihalobacillus sp. R86527 TaxID=3093863 RepID=UPI0036715D49